MGGDRITLPLLVAGATHAAVDAVCAVLLFWGLATGRLDTSAGALAFIGYGLLAFGTQPIIGFVADHFGWYRGAAVTGASMVMVAPLATVAPGGFAIAVVLAGLGNAAFHVGAGVFSIRATPGRALAPGIFVAPGAAGLTLGTVAGRAGTSPVLFAVVLGVLTLALAVTLGHAGAQLRRAPETRTSLTPIRGAEYALLLILMVVTARSFIGTAIAFPWRTAPGMLVALTVAVVVGKGLGGLLADHFGWLRTGVLTLLCSAVLLTVGDALPIAGLAGLLAFNMTMPITLVAIAEVMPEHPGTAFGLTCVALIAGAFPQLAGVPVATGPSSMVPALAVASAFVLALALRRVGPRAGVGASLRPLPEGSP